MDYVQGELLIYRLKHSREIPAWPASAYSAGQIHCFLLSDPHHPLTDAGIAKFQADYKAVFGE